MKRARSAVLLVGVLLPIQAPESPRIALLQSNLAAGEQQAVEAFWSELETKGMPLFEPAGESGRTLVTFVWRGDADIQNVIMNFDAETRRPVEAITPVSLACPKGPRPLRAASRRARRARR